MRTFLLLSILIFGIYLYFTIDQTSKDNITAVTLDIPNRVQSVASSLSTNNWQGGTFTFNWNYKQE